MATTIRPLGEKERCYWEIQQTSPLGLRVGVLPKGAGSVGDLWAIGFSFNSDGFVYAKGNQEGTYSYVLQSHSPLMDESIHPLGSYENSRGFDRRLIGLLYDKGDLSLYCNRKFVVTVFRRLPTCYPAISNGTGPTSALVRFYGDYIPPPVETMDEAFPMWKQYVNH